MQSRRIMTLFVIALLMCGSSAVSAASFNTSLRAQDKPADVSGKYEGVAKSAALGEIPLTVEIKSEGGKISGKIDTAQGALPITSGTYADGKIMMKFDAGGTEGTVTAKPMGDKIVGEWEMGGQTGTIELKKVTVAAAGPPAGAPPANPPPASDQITGKWAANADAGGNRIDFTLDLKLDAGKVSGTSESDMGSATLSKGTFAGDKLDFTLETPNGVITFTAVLKAGVLTGEYDFAGQAKGKWEAKKK
jgi:hypothetical protein